MIQRLSSGRIVLALIAVLFTFTACDDGGGGTRTNGLVSSPTATLAVRVDPFQLQLAPILPRASCPMTQPFMTHFDLVIGPPSADVFVDTITLRFGSGGTPTVFISTDLDRMFGNRQIPAHSRRVFTMAPQFGCGLSATPGTVVVIVGVIDGSGQRHEATATATIG
jgi:hypothetical protein